MSTTMTAMLRISKLDTQMLQWAHCTEGPTTWTGPHLGVQITSAKCSVSGFRSANGINWKHPFPLCSPRLSCSSHVTPLPHQAYQWHHLAAVRSANNWSWSLYINGTLFGSFKYGCAVLRGISL